jgi:hypothetical protein
LASCSAKAAFQAAIWLKPFATLIRVSCSFAVSLELLRVDSEEEIFPRTTRFRFTSTVRALENVREKNFEKPIFLALLLFNPLVESDRGATPLGRELF